jgi:hypothetical protein
MKNPAVYRAYDPDSQTWYDIPRTAVRRSVPSAKASRPVTVSLPDGTVATRPATGLRRHRADGHGGTRRN